MVTTALELTPGRFDLVELTGRAVIRRELSDGHTGLGHGEPEKPVCCFARPGSLARARSATTGGSFTSSNPASTSDGDGTRDVTCWPPLSPEQCIALSGKDGSMLWNFVADTRRPRRSARREPGFPRQAEAG